MKILTYDNNELEIEKSKLEKSGVIKDLLEINLKGDTIPLLCKYCNLDVINAIFQEENINYTKIENTLLVKMIIVSDYLDIPLILEKSTSEIAIRIKKCDSENEINQLFQNIEITKD